jgi:cupin 2 domain-containing protein
MDNIFTNLPAQHSADEEFTNLLVRPGTRIERIVSTGQATLPGEWCDQDWEEWVILLKGSAGLLIDGENERTLSPGDHVFIPARRRHRVTWTHSDQPTIWLAVHLRPEETQL